MGNDGGVLGLVAVMAVVLALGALCWVVRIAVRDGLADARPDACGGVPENSEGGGSKGVPGWARSPRRSE